MKNQRSYFLILILPIMLLTSCTKEVKYFDLTMQFCGPIVNIEENDKLPRFYGNLMGYYRDTGKEDTIFVPVVKIERTDFKPPKQLDYEIPLSSLNRFRKKLGLLSAPIIEQEYENAIENNKLLTPKILIEPIGTRIIDLEKPEFNNALKINLETYNDSISHVVWNSIKDKLNSGKAKEKIDLIFYIPKVDPVMVLIDKADSLYNIDNKHEALIIYKEVIELDPENIHANQRIEELIEAENNIALEDYFEKIADGSISILKRNKFKKDIIEKYFANERSLVIEKGINNTKVNTTNIKTYLDEVGLRHYRIEILDKKTNNQQKITTLYIREYDTK